MTTILSRRSLLAGATALAATTTLAHAASGAAASADWRLGFRNAPAAGLGPMRLRRLHGRLPADLSGVLYRNGPAQFTWGADQLGHWFDGDGLIRAFHLNEGAARLTARFVDTPKRRNDMANQAFVTPGFGTRGRAGGRVANNDDTNAANTSVIMVADRLWALWEGGSPTALDPQSLATEGAKSLSPDMAHMPFSAHPKVEPDTGRIWNFGLSFGGQSVIVWALSAGGAVEKAEVVRLPRKAYLHDWAVTRTKLILPLQPWVMDRMQLPIVEALSWKPEMGMAVLVIDKDDFSKQRIYELPAAAFFHTGDAWETADGVVCFDVCFSDTPTVDAVTGGALARAETPPNTQRPALALVRLNPNGSASVDQLGISAEFPCIDPRRAGTGPGVCFFASQSAAPSPHPIGFDSIASHDWRHGRSQRFVYGAHQMVEEHVFAPKARGRGGYLIGTTLNLRVAAMELHVLDAERIDDGPLASFSVDAPLPLGFHGTWRSTQ